LISSAVTHTGKLPKKTVKLIQLLDSLRGWNFFVAVKQEGTGADLSPVNDNRPICVLQCYPYAISFLFLCLTNPQNRHPGAG
jgi:hypothetical protein